MRRVAAAFLVALAATATGCGSETPAPDDGAAYVALGDSYTAGPGIEPIGDKDCSRSELNYPSLVAKALGIEKFADRSCGGARVSNLEEPQEFRTTRLNDPQLDAVGKDTELVTIGMGLNDRAISTGLLLVCVTPTAPEPNDVCKRYLALPDSVIEDQIRDAADDVAAAVEDIAEQAPKARIVVVGYPRVAPETGSCPDLFPVPAAQLTRLRGAMEVANEAWGKAARDAGALFVDMYTPSEGHDICSADPWVSGYKGVPGKARGLHPFASYHQAVAQRVVDVLDE